MGIETVLIASAIASGVGAAQGLKASQNEAKAIVRQGELNAANAAKRTKVRASAQRQSFLSSGLELQGSPLSAIQETIDFGQRDVRQIESNARIQAKNTLAKGRAQFISQVAGAGLSLAGGMGAFSGGSASGATSLADASSSVQAAPQFGPNAKTFTLR